VASMFEASASKLVRDLPLDQSETKTGNPLSGCAVAGVGEWQSVDISSPLAPTEAGSFRYRNRISRRLYSLRLDRMWPERDYARRGR